MWLNPARREWDEILLAATGLTLSHMPGLYEGCDPIAELSVIAAAELGLPQVPVVAGAGDNAGGAVGVGIIDPGQGFLSLGTSGVIFVVSDRHFSYPEATVHAFCHCLPNRWHQMSVSLSAANSLSWLAKIVNLEVGELLARLEQSGKTETSVLFLPMIGISKENTETAIHQICIRPPVQSSHTPKSARSDYLGVKLARYRKLYELTKRLK